MELYHFLLSYDFSIVQVVTRPLCLDTFDFTSFLTRQKLYTKQKIMVEQSDTQSDYRSKIAKFLICVFIINIHFLITSPKNHVIN